MGWLSGILAVFVRLWDFCMSPNRRAQRAKDEVDKAIREHDSTKINELLDRNL